MNHRQHEIHTVLGCTRAKWSGWTTCGMCLNENASLALRHSSVTRFVLRQCPRHNCSCSGATTARRVRGHRWLVLDPGCASGSPGLALALTCVEHGRRLRRTCLSGLRCCWHVSVKDSDRARLSTPVRRGATAVMSHRWRRRCGGDLHLLRVHVLRCDVAPRACSRLRRSVLLLPQVVQRVA